MDKDKLIEWIFKVAVVTLSIVVMSVVVVLLTGLFEEKIDNKEIFAIIGPAFNTIVGAFVGLLGGLSIAKSSKD